VREAQIKVGPASTIYSLVYIGRKTHKASGKIQIGEDAHRIKAQRST
jgi:hypothetical protein